jgi:Lysozyme like domain
MDTWAAGVPDESEFERQQRLYRERVSRRRAALRLAHADRRDRHRLRALRRLDRGEPRVEPRANRRPALVLAVVFLVLTVSLIFIARAAGGEADRHRIRSAICSVFTGTRCGPAIRVATCETGGTLNPRARGRLGERGLFQIHPVHFRTFNPRRLFEVLYNVRAAFRLSRGGRDWSPWTCQP